ncbi:hypothetical protein PMSD_23010 [Paenibacillus macquariensis subsp. defensor]|nr:hypothetical protein PMSD_23010 [Paenibacillus macquariensis subsp. defensor]
MTFKSFPKPKYKRNKPTAKQRGAISPEVYDGALERSKGLCERCKEYGELQCAHLVRRWKIEVSTTVNDVAMLCGPSTNTGTCHNWVDYTRVGKEWAIDYREQLYKNVSE